MKYCFSSSRSFPVSIFLLIFCVALLNAQPEVVDAVEYKQITHFETDQYISTMKMSADGSKIVFATSGPVVKVFTLNTNGTGLTEIYDFQRNGNGPSVDISGNGEKVIWCDGEGEIFIANSDGSGREELATLIPNPDPNFADLEPIIPLPPRITADGSQVLFINMDRDPRISGVWKVNADNSSLTQVFNYLDLSSDVFGRDGTEYNRNTAFADGFDITGDGSSVLIGTRIFKLEEGDLDRGHLVMAWGTEFYELGEYAGGNQPFAIGIDGGFCIVYRREYNPTLEYDEINVYFVPVGTGDPVKVIAGLDIFGVSAYTQMALKGSRAITVGANGRLPITLVERVPGSRLDLVSVDGASIAAGGFRMSESWFPSTDVDGKKYCFMAPSVPPQIWMANLLSDGRVSQPKITGVNFEPNYVLKDASSPATIEALITDLYNPVHTVTFESFQNGHPYFRALGSVHPSGFLFDDGALGDKSPGDGVYTNNTVNIDVADPPVGEYTIRIAAVNSTLEEITMVDAKSMSILEESTSVQTSAKTGFVLHPNFPNPFGDQTSIAYELAYGTEVELCVFDILGKRVATLMNGPKAAGQHTSVFNPGNLPDGIYYYTIRAGDFVQTRKMEMLK
jgi:hypothetical protein